MSLAPRAMFRRFAFAVLLLLAAISFSAPAFEAHACAGDDAVSATSALDADCADCPDCGPECADGCCHAGHLGFVDIPGTPTGTPAFIGDHAWGDAAAPPALRPAGPERPPRS